MKDDPDPQDILTPELLESLAEDAEMEGAQFTERMAALRHCREQLGLKSRQLLELYYEAGLSMKEISDRLQSNSNAVKQALFRVRRTLLDCIQSSLPSSAK